MTHFLARRSLTAAAFMAVVASLSIAGCGKDDDSTANNSTVTLKDISLPLTAGETCNGGGNATDFSGTAGKSVVITASGSSSNMTPVFILYAPDYAEQLAGSSATGAGKSKLTFTLVETGVHHISLCDEHAVGGNVRIVVTQQTF